MKALILAALLAQAATHYVIGDELDLDVVVTAPIDWAKPLQWRRYDLLCEAPKKLPAEHIHCRVIGLREPT
jgi:hypothetical protein